MEQIDTTESTHGHHHDPAEMKKIANRLAKAEGHLRAVQRMVLSDKDCTDVLIQLAAVIGSLNSAGREILKQHISHCIVHAVQNDDQEALKQLNSAIDYFIKIG